MTTPPEVRPPAYRLYSPGGVVCATVFGSAVAGGIVLALNYWRLGQKRQAWLAVALGIATAGLLIGLACILPDKVPAAVFQLPPIVIALHLTKQLQGDAFRLHLAAGGKKASNWKGVGVGCLILGFVVAAFVAWFLTTGVSLRSALDMQHSLTIGNGNEIYYSRGATEDMARQVGASLQKQGFFSPQSEITVILAGTGSDKEISFVVKEGAWDEPSTVEALQTLAAQAAESIGGKPITLRLLDVNGKEKKRIAID